MDPVLMMLLTGLASAGIGAATGKPGEQKSSFSKGQKGGIQDILDAIKGMKGGAMDITQQPGYQQGNEWLMSMFNDPEFFKNIEAPAFRQLEEDILPGIANRFASMGSGGSTGSTGFRNATARAGTDLATNLAAQRTGMQQNAIPNLLQYAQQPFQNLMSLYSQALGQPVYNQYQPPSTGGFGSLAAPLISGAAQGYASRIPGQNPSTF